MCHILLRHLAKNAVLWKASGSVQIVASSAVGDVRSNDTFCYSCDDFIGPEDLIGSEEDSSDDASSAIDNASSEEESHDHTAVIDDGAKGRVGLVNLGNSCYMNSILQVIAHIPRLRDFFLHNRSIDVKLALSEQLPSLPSRPSRRNNDPDLIIERISLLSEMLLLMLRLWSPKHPTKPFAPSSIFTAVRNCFPRFKGFQQQDAQEYFHLLLERLHYEALEIVSGPHNRLPQDSIITDAFQGQVSSKVACRNCGNEAVKSDPFREIPLTVPSSEFLRKQTNGYKLRYCHLLDCLRRFCTTETLVHSEMYRCGRCGSLSEAIKDMRFAWLPPVLVFQLKRFDFHLRLLKIRRFIEFPLEGLDLSTFCRDSSKSSLALYSLVGVVCHHGSSPRQGHYTAFVKEEEGGWLHCDDQRVRECSAAEVSACEAYILVYTRI